MLKMKLFNGDNLQEIEAVIDSMFPNKNNGGSNMDLIREIKDSCGMEDTTIQPFNLNNDQIVIAVIPTNDADLFDSPACLLFNEKLMDDTEYQDSIWELLDPDIKTSVIKMGCSLYEFVICYTIIEIHHGHTDPLAVHTIDIERLSGYIAARLQYMVVPMLERIKAYAEDVEEDEAEELAEETV